MEHSVNDSFTIRFAILLKKGLIYTFKIISKLTFTSDYTTVGLVIIKGGGVISTIM